MKNIYFDMDGVLMKYDPSAYIGENPLYKKKGFHYFRDLEPDTRAIDIAKRLNQDPTNQVFVLSQVSNDGMLFLEHTQDKIASLKEHAKFINTEKQLIVTASEKCDIVSYLASSDTLTLGDILIDDYNPNLIAWAKKGGTAIKFLNGINSPNKDNPNQSYDGLHITEEMTPNDVVNMLGFLPDIPESRIPQAAGTGKSKAQAESFLFLNWNNLIAILQNWTNLRFKPDPYNGVPNINAWSQDGQLYVLMYNMNERLHRPLLENAHQKYGSESPSIDAERAVISKETLLGILSEELRPQEKPYDTCVTLETGIYLYTR